MIFKASVDNNLFKLLDSPYAGSIFRVSALHGFHRFFGLGWGHQPWYAEAFGKCCSAMETLDVMLELSSFKEYLRETGKMTKERDLTRHIKLAVFPLIFHRYDPQLSLKFATVFLPQKWASRQYQEFLEALQGYSALAQPPSTDFRTLLQSLLPFFQERGFRFCLGFAYIATALTPDETNLTDFLVWFNQKGLRLKIEFLVDTLGIDV